jgi:hypothetical protein
MGCWHEGGRKACAFVSKQCVDRVEELFWDIDTGLGEVRFLGGLMRFAMSYKADWSDDCSVRAPHAEAMAYGFTWAERVFAC